MTYNEIIKAFECCTNYNCDYCPYDNENDTFEECVSKLTKDAFNVINHLISQCDAKDVIINSQQAEINELKAMSEVELDTIHALGDDYERVLEEESVLIKKAKVDAIKEFAERLRKRLERKYTIYGREYVLRHIKELLKEMTEQRKEDEGK